MTEVVMPRLLELIDDWSARTTKKQRITGTRLHRQLVAEGFVVGETTVRRLYREWRRQRQEVFVPLVHRAGDEAQVDFFEVVIEVGGDRRKAWMFVMRLMHSSRDFAWLYDHGDQVSFLDGHVRAFEHFGGVPSRCIYDNLASAVKKVLFPGRELTDRFRALASAYLFEPCFARVGVGHDKGGVEGRGKGIRLQHLVPIPRGESVEEIAKELVVKLDQQAKTKRNARGQTVMEAFAEEAERLRTLPAHPFEPRLVVPLCANRKSLVVYDGATYSLPSHWNKLDVTAYVGPTDIRFFCREEVVVRQRVQKRQRNIQYRDYLGELSKKPQAVRQVAPELMAELGEPYGRLWKLLEATHGGREAGRVVARILAAIVKHGESEVTMALGDALDTGTEHIAELSGLHDDPDLTEIDIPEPLRQYAIESAKATDFDALLFQEAC